METAVAWIPLAMSDTEAPAADADARLMLQFQAGDLAAFEVLFSRHSRSIVNFAYRFVRNREVAEELAQEVFIKVYDAARNYRAEAKFTTWLYRIATNVCLNEIRRPHFRTPHQSLDTPASDDPDDRPPEIADTVLPSPETQMQRRGLRELLKRALDALPEKQRVAFILNKYQELSYAETADVMRTSEKAVKSLIHRAKEALAERLASLVPELGLK
jgi:RNA polymerase sigma-70 factor (ECF subfamily)